MKAKNLLLIPTIFVNSALLAANTDISANITDAASSITISGGDSGSITKSIAISGSDASLTATGTNGAEPAVASTINLGAYTLSINNGGRLNVLDGAVFNFSAANANINISGTGEAAGKFILNGASLTSDVTGNKYFTGSGDAVFEFTNSTVAAKDNTFFNLSGNAKISLDNTAWASSQKIRVNLSGNSTFEVKNGSSYAYDSYLSTFSLTENSKFLITGTGSLFKVGNPATGAAPVMSIVGNSTFEAADNAKVEATRSVVYTVSGSSKINVLSGAEFNTTSYNAADSINPYNTVVMSGTASLNVNAATFKQNAQGTKINRIDFSGNSALNIANTGTLTSASVNIVHIREAAKMTVTEASTLAAGNYIIGTNPADAENTQAAIMEIRGLGNTINITSLAVYGEDNTTALAQLGGGVQFIADEDGISTLKTVSVSEFSGVLLLDFSEFLGDSEAGKSYTFDLITANSDWAAIAANLTDSEGVHSALVDLIKASADDQWSVKYGANKLYLEYIVGTPIPEPSTYAAIFGALALALAAYKRRSRK